VGMKPYEIMLADDDSDDCSLFEEALAELPGPNQLHIATNGSELMHMLASGIPRIPDILFLDLNMPLKNGFECLAEIKADHRLRNIPVIVYSTSLDISVVDLLYEKGAYRYLRKPASFSELKTAIKTALGSIGREIAGQPSKDEFIIVT
jgi:CheY-like chemotaxis protein